MKTHNVLFIGNSHTYYENLPWLFSALCKQAGKDVRSVMLTHPNVDWRWHLNSYCSIPNIQFGVYDYVVLQQRAHPFDDGETFFELGVELFRAVSGSGATAVFMNTWSEKDNPGGQKKVDKAFVALHDLCKGSLIAKCGGAWHRLRGMLDLYAKDGKHQNAKGAYLNACVLAKTIFEIDPTKLPLQYEPHNLSARLAEDEIRLLQIAAAE